MTTTPDVIDQLAGVGASTALDELRRRRPQTRDNAQASYLALFEPAFPGTVTALERFAVAAFVVGLHRDADISRWYDLKLDATAPSPVIPAAIATEGSAGFASGPYGHYTQGPLQAENTDGLQFHVSPRGAEVLGARLGSALNHAHLLVFRPREASRAALDTLLAAGWSADDIVTLSQLVAFLSFQIRVVSGLRTLNSTLAQPAVPQLEESAR